MMKYKSGPLHARWTNPPLARNSRKLLFQSSREIWEISSFIRGRAKNGKEPRKKAKKAVFQAAKTAVVAGNSTEEARKRILSKTLQNQKNKMKRKAKKANSVSKPNMVESAKPIHQVSLILKKRQRSDDQATPETESKKPQVTPRSADHGTPNVTGIEIKSSDSNLTPVIRKVPTGSTGQGASSRGALGNTMEPSSSKVNTRSFKDVLVEDLTVGLVNVDGSSIDSCTAKVLQDKMDDLINITVTKGLPAQVFTSVRLVNGNYKVTCKRRGSLMSRVLDWHAVGRVFESGRGMEIFLVLI